MQILLEEDRYQKLAHEAERREQSIAAVIRDAVDRMLDQDLERRRAAIDAILAAEPMEVPDDPMDLKREIEEAHDRLDRWS
ncbi:MAG TPA: hypothetical protein VKU60_06710 [Chloroflexota bacterium]|nr:hypothetical protein [Chloroflexota bacterium]